MTKCRKCGLSKRKLKGGINVELFNHFHEVVTNQTASHVHDPELMFQDLKNFFKIILGHLDLDQQKRRGKLTVIAERLLEQARKSIDKNMPTWFNAELYAEFETTLFQEPDVLVTEPLGKPSNTRKPPVEFPPVPPKKSGTGKSPFLQLKFLGKRSKK